MVTLNYVRLDSVSINCERLLFSVSIQTYDNNSRPSDVSVEKYVTRVVLFEVLYMTPKTLDQIRARSSFRQDDQQEVKLLVQVQKLELEN